MKDVKLGYTDLHPTKNTKEKKDRVVGLKFFSILLPFEIANEHLSHGRGPLRGFRRSPQRSEEDFLSEILGPVDPHCPLSFLHFIAI